MQTWLSGVALVPWPEGAESASSVLPAKQQLCEEEKAVT